MGGDKVPTPMGTPSQLLTVRQQAISKLSNLKQLVLTGT